MIDDPRTKARTFLESSTIISELEEVLNDLVHEKPDDLHGFLVSGKICWQTSLAPSFGFLQANHFLDQSKQPQITALSLRRLVGPAGEPAVHIDLTVAHRNRTQVENEFHVFFASRRTCSLAL